MLKKIVVALDGSEFSERAFQFACDLATKFGSSLCLAHVVTSRDIPEDLKRMAEIEHLIPARLKAATEEVSTDSGFGQVVRNVEKTGEAYEILEKLGEHLLQSSADEAREKGVESVQTKLLQGDPAGELIHLIKSEKADAVVSGSRGLGNLRGLLVGSVSNKLSQHAPCACIMVK